MKILSTRAREKHAEKPPKPMEFFAVALTRRFLEQKTMFRSGLREISHGVSWNAAVNFAYYDSEYDAAWIKVRALTGGDGRPFMQPVYLELNAAGIFHFKQGLWTAKKWNLTSCLVDESVAYAPEPLFTGKFPVLVPDYDSDNILVL